MTNEAPATKSTTTPLRLSEVRPGLQRAYLLVYTTAGTVTGARCRSCMTNVDPTLDAMTWHRCDDENES